MTMEKNILKKFIFIIFSRFGAVTKVGGLKFVSGVVKNDT